MNVAGVHVLVLTLMWKIKIYKWMKNRDEE
jgi:hypothetical protein